MSSRLVKISVASRSHVVTSRDDFCRIAQSSSRHVMFLSRRAVMSSCLMMMLVASRSHVVTYREDCGRVAAANRHFRRVNQAP